MSGPVDKPGSDIYPLLLCQLQALGEKVACGLTYYVAALDSAVAGHTVDDVEDSLRFPVVNGLSECFQVRHPSNLC